MQSSGRTPSSILRKRASQEEQNRRRSVRAKGRRVSFAPDDELETMHLFCTDKNSPLPSQDTQPLAELQNQMPQPGDPASQGGWGSNSLDKQPQQGSGFPGDLRDSDPMLLHHQQHHQLQQPEGFLLMSPGATSDMSMELTNDTMQQGQHQHSGGSFGLAAAPAASPGGLRDENDGSFAFAAAAAAAAGGGSGGGGPGMLLPSRDAVAPFQYGRDVTHNITNDIPGLSTLVEEDEELWDYGGAGGTTPAGPAAAVAADADTGGVGGFGAGGSSPGAGGGDGDTQGMTMELTGTSAAVGGDAATAEVAAAADADARMLTEEVTPQPRSPATRRRSRSSGAAVVAEAGAAAAAAAASPNVTPGRRRSSRRASQDAAGAAAAATPSPAPAAAAATTPVSPASRAPRGSRSRRSSTAAAAAAVQPETVHVYQLEQQQTGVDAQGAPQQEQQEEQAPATASAGAAGTPNAAAGGKRRSAGTACGIGSALKAPAPSLDPTPSPLRRITRSMASPLASPELQGGGAAAAGAAADSRRGFFESIDFTSSGSLTEGFTEALEAATAAGAGGGDEGGAGMGGRAAGPAAAGGAGGRSRRSSVGRFAEQQSRWGLVPGQDDTLDINMDLPGAGGLGDATLHHVYAESAGTGDLTRAMKPGQPLAAASAAAAAAAAAKPAGGGGGRRRSSIGRRSRVSLATDVIPEEVAVTPQLPVQQEEQECREEQGQEQQGWAAQAGEDVAAAADGEVSEDDMDISASLGGATPGLLGGLSGQPRAPAAAAAGAADADGLTTNLLLDETGRPSLPGWGHVPLAGGRGGATAAAASAAGLAGPQGMASLAAGGAGMAGRTSGGGMTTMMTGRGSVGSNVLTMHTHRFGHTTQLLDDSHHDSHREDALAAHLAAEQQHQRQQRQPRRSLGANADAAAAALDDCTTKLLADSTSASACGIMGLLPHPRVPLLSTTIAGGAPAVAQPPAVAAPAAMFGGSGSAAAAPAFGQHDSSGDRGHQQHGAGGDGIGADAAVSSPGRFGEPDGYESPELGSMAPAAVAADYGDDDDTAIDMEEDTGMQALQGATAAAAGAGSNATPAAAAPASAMLESPVHHWQQQGQQQQVSAWQGRSPSVSPMVEHPQYAVAGAPASHSTPAGISSAEGAGVPSPAVPAAGRPAAGGQDGNEPTLELAAGVTQGVGGASTLEDATLEDFALPPEMAAAEERPITLPFSGALNAGTGTLATTPGGSMVVRAAQPITFSDFCQVVDMQFITNLRRGTSIGVCDFAPSSTPQDLSQALQLLSITSSEVAVLEGAMHELQGEMHSKRRDAYELEERLGDDNPVVFSSVQTARPTQLEQTKHCLILLRKACRSQTLTRWKRLRIHMEQQLADKLAQQQADLDEQLAFVQAKLQKAQQQREYAKAFHADVLKRLAAEEAQQQEAAAARVRLVCLRKRLDELRDLNADRQAHAEGLQERVAQAEARRGDLAAQLSALRARCEELGAQLSATPQPTTSCKALAHLQQASERLAVLQHIQGWKLVGSPDGSSFTLVFRGGAAGIRFSLQDGGPAAGGGARATGSLVLLQGDDDCAAAAAAGARSSAAAGASGALSGPLARQLLRDMATCLQPRCSFTAPPSLLPGLLSEAELVLSRVLDLAETCQDLFLSQPLLTGISLCQTGAKAFAASTGAGGAAEGRDCLCLTLIEAEQQLKVQLLLPLADLISHAHPGAGRRLRAAVQVVVAPSASAAAAVQQQVEQRLQSMLAGAAAAAAAAGHGGGCSSAAGLVSMACHAAAECLAGDAEADSVPATQ